MVGLSAGSTSIVQVYGGLTDLDAGSHDLPVHRWSALLWMAKVRKVNIYHELNADGQVYHVDKGEGCDFYGVGAARGVGGTCIWAEGKLWTSKVYKDYEIIRNDPSRISFVLTYEPFDVAGITVTEKKQIDMVLGTPFYKITSTISTSDSSPVVYAVGISEFGKGVVNKYLEEGKFFVSEWISAPDVHYNGMLSWAPETQVFGAAFAQPSAVAGIVQD